MHLRTSHGICNVKKFEDLPCDIYKVFVAISSMAFHGIKLNSRVFVDSACPSDTLSLMEAHQKLTSYGPSTSYGFLHYSVQEFLAAWHMSRLGREEQAKAVSDILHSSPLSPVLPFFAGLTKLSNPAVRGILLEVAKHTLHSSAILANQPQVESDDRRRLLLALLNCIYESQSSTLCKDVKPPIFQFGRSTTILCKDGPLTFSIGRSTTHISLRCLTLEANEGLSIGYFIANHGFSSVDIAECSIGDSGVEALMAQLKLGAEVLTNSHSMRTLYLGDNQTTCLSMRSVSKVLQLQTPLLSSLSFAGDSSWLPTQVQTYMKYLIEGLSRSSASVEIALPISVTSEHTHYLVLLITTCKVNQIRLPWSDIQGGFPSLAEALKQTTVLQEAVLPGCSIGNEQLIALGQKVRTSLTMLMIPENPFTSSALREFLRYQYFSRLEELDIGRPLNQEELLVYRQLLWYRHQTGLPSLTLSAASNQIGKEVETLNAIHHSLPKGVQERIKNI